MKKRFIYSAGELYEVSEDIYDAMNQLTNKVHYRRRSAGQCRANQREMAACDGDCPMCKYYSSSELSVEEMEMRNDCQIPDSKGVDRNANLYVEEILNLMQACDPQGAQIGKMYLKGYTDSEIANKLGIPKSTFSDRKNRIRKFLKKHL